LMLDDEGVHALVVILTVNVNYDSLMSWLAEHWHGWDKPVLIIVAGNGLTGRGLDILVEQRVPFFRTINSGINALSKLATYAHHLSTMPALQSALPHLCRATDPVPSLEGQLSE